MADNPNWPEWQVTFPDGDIYVVRAVNVEKAKALAIMVRKVDKAFER